MGEPAQKLIAKTVINALRNERWFIEDGNDDDRSNVEYHKVAAVLAAEVDKALGGLKPEYGVRYEGDPWPEESFDTEREADSVAAMFCRSCDTCRNSFPRQVESRWVSRWSEASDVLRVASGVVGPAAFTLRPLDIEALRHWLVELQDIARTQMLASHPDTARYFAGRVDGIRDVLAHLSERADG